MHDHVALYRAWHHTPFRAAIHTHIAVVALLLASAAVLQLGIQAPVQAATGIFADFPFQGRLTNPDGTVVANGNYDAVFQLYTVDTGGSPVWTEAHTGGNQVSTIDGIFNTMLGSITTLGGIDFNQDEYWLGITVGSDSEMTPRIRLGSAPYSFNSDKLDGVSSEAFLQLPGQAGGQTAYGGTAASENLVLRSTTDGTKGNIILGDDGTTPIGVGTATPFQNVLGAVSLGGGGIHVSTGTDVARTLLEGNDPSYELINNTAGANQKWTELFQSTSGYFGIFTRNDAGVRLQPSNANPAFAVDNSSGYAGVGTANPDAKFTVDTSSTSPATNALNVHATWNSGGNYDANNTIVTDTSSGGFSTLMSALRTDGVNTLTSYAVGKNGILMAGNSTGTNDMRINVQDYNSNAATGTSIAFDRHRGTFSGPLSVSSGDKLGSIDFRGGYTTSSATADAAQIVAEVDGTPSGASDMPGRLVFKTTPDGSGTLATRLTVTNAGNIIPGTGALSTSASDGFLYLGAMAGAPTGAATAYSGRVPLTYDTNANTLYAYNSGWQAIGGGSISGSGAAGRVTVWNGTSSVTSDAEFLWDTTNNRLRIGTSAADSGSIGLPNNSYISARNAADSANQNLIAIDSVNHIAFGFTNGSSTITDFDTPNNGGSRATWRFQNPNNTSGTAVVDLELEGNLTVHDADSFASNTATSGIIRIPNNASLTARNAANTGNIDLITANATDQTQFDFVSGSNNQIDFVTKNNGGVRTDWRILNPNNTSSTAVADLDIEGVLKVHDADNFAAAVGTSGIIRIPNNTALTARNASDTANLDLIASNTNDQIQFDFTGGTNNVIDFVTKNNGGVRTDWRLQNPNNTSSTAVADLDIEGALKVYNQDSFGSSIASSGIIRLPNNNAISVRNAGNTGDIDILKVSAADQIEIGFTSGSTTTNFATPNNGGTRATWRFQNPNTTSSSAVLDLETEGSLIAHNLDSFGNSAASSGVIRIPSNQSISARNAGNSADVSLLKLNTSDKVEVGGDLTLNGGDYYDATIPSAVSSTTLCISGGGQIGTCTSDARLKTNIQDIGSGLAVIEQLSPKTFDFISGQTNQSGFLAQDVQKILPGAVTKDTGDDYLSLNYSNITAYTVKAIQELSQKIDQLPVVTSLAHKTITVTSLNATNITVANSASLGSLHVAGDAAIDGSLAVAQAVTIGTDLTVQGNLILAGALKGNAKTRGIDVAINQNGTSYTVSGLGFDKDTPYAVNVTPNWITTFSVTNKTEDGFTVTFAQPAPDNASFDYFIEQ